jgi:hypothetical protein
MADFAVNKFRKMRMNLQMCSQYVNINVENRKER